MQVFPATKQQPHHRSTCVTLGDLHFSMSADKYRTLNSCSKSESTIRSDKLYGIKSIQGMPHRISITLL